MNICHPFFNLAPASRQGIFYNTFEYCHWSIFEFGASKHVTNIFPLRLFTAASLQNLNILRLKYWYKSILSKENKTSSWTLGPCHIKLDFLCLQYHRWLLVVYKLTLTVLFYVICNLSAIVYAFIVFVFVSENILEEIKGTFIMIQLYYKNYMWRVLYLSNFATWLYPFLLYSFDFTWQRKSQLTWGILSYSIEMLKAGGDFKCYIF